MDRDDFHPLKNWTFETFREVYFDLHFDKILQWQSAFQMMSAPSGPISVTCIPVSCYIAPLSGYIAPLGKSWRHPCCHLSLRIAAYVVNQSICKISAELNLVDENGQR